MTTGFLLRTVHPKCSSCNITAPATAIRMRTIVNNSESTFVNSTSSVVIRVLAASTDCSWMICVKGVRQGVCLYQFRVYLGYPRIMCMTTVTRVARVRAKPTTLVIKSHVLAEPSSFAPTDD